MFPARSISSRRALLGAATALIALGPVSAASAASPTSDAQASARLQARAEVQTEAAVRLADAGTTRAAAAIRRAGDHLSRAHGLATRAVSEGDASLSAEVAVKFAGTFAETSGHLTVLADRTSGKLERKAAELAREVARLNAEVTAAVASRADVGADAELTASLATADGSNVEGIERLVATVKSGALGAGARERLTQAAGVTVVMRGAVTARLAGLRAAALATSTVALDRTGQALRAGSTRLVEAIHALLPSAPVVGADASVSAQVRFPGLRVAADALAQLGGSRAALKAVMRAA